MNKEEKQKFIRFLKFNNIYNEYLFRVRTSNTKGLHPSIFLNNVDIESAIYTAFTWPENKWHYYNAAWMHVWLGLSLEETRDFNGVPHTNDEISSYKTIIELNTKYFEEYEINGKK